MDAHFPEIFVYLANQGHATRPAQLHRLDVNKIKIGFIRQGKLAEFFYNNYADNGQMIIYLDPSRNATQTPHGVHVEAEPRDVNIIITTTKYQMSMAELERLKHSSLTPDSVSAALLEFQQAVSANYETMIHVLNNRLNEDEGYFLENDKSGSKYHKVIDNDYVKRFVSLKPKADKVAAAIRAYWKN